MGKDDEKEPTERRHDLDDTEEMSTKDGLPRDTTTPNPPRTTTGVWTSPKFGSAGSGGAELEPGLDKN